MNEKYFLSDKKVMETLASFKILPENYANNILSALACPGETLPDQVKSVARMEAAWQSVTDLAGDYYQARF